ncbi:anaphase-promoting complex subunit 2 [Dermatophagoides pteronyssinus]|uniref:Anaphase-promoting complex subunit 2 n=1 Tax=Dermatophagoides pteronyssinus TaxID=6956 RepID=A0ABQ8JTF6_DERPT|nr:anaphase-promoting complex subunit 2 [Dermatophagoides pteronyssinus]
MSESPLLCQEMRNCGYVPMLIRLIHQQTMDDHDDFNLEQLQQQQQSRVHRNLIQALNNIVQHTKRNRKELKILKILEDLKAFVEILLKKFLENQPDSTPESVDHPCNLIIDLYKMCSEQQSIEFIEYFGGVFVISEVIKIDYKCHGDSHNEDCYKIRLYSLMILTHVTFNNPQVKSLLGSKKSFLIVLIELLRISSNEDLIQAIAKVIQNLSWDTNYISMQTMRDVKTVTHLTNSMLIVKKESTIKCLLAALGNLTASSPQNKADFCRVNGGLEFLIKSMKITSNDNDSIRKNTSPDNNNSCKNTDNNDNKISKLSISVVEASGRILRNISSYLATEEKYRQILREHNVILMLLNHLESSSLDVVSNACVILSNLSVFTVLTEESSRDQILMIESNAITKLAKLIHSKHRTIREGAMATYKHLVTSHAYLIHSSFNNDGQQQQQQNQTNNHHQRLSTSLSISSFPMRKMKAIKNEIANLSTLNNLNNNNNDEIIPIDLSKSFNFGSSNHNRSRFSRSTSHDSIRRNINNNGNNNNNNSHKAFIHQDETSEIIDDDNDELDYTTDFSERYKDDEDGHELSGRHHHHHHHSHRNRSGGGKPTSESVGEDSVKIYETEGTPLAFSLAPSLSDLHDIDLKSIYEDERENEDHLKKTKPKLSSKVSNTSLENNVDKTSKNTPNNLSPINLTSTIKLNRNVSRISSKSIDESNKKPILPPKPSSTTTTTNDKSVSEDDDDDEDEQILKKCIEFALPTKKKSIKSSSSSSSSSTPKNSSITDTNNRRPLYNQQNNHHKSPRTNNNNNNNKQHSSSVMTKNSSQISIMTMNHQNNSNVIGQQSISSQQQSPLLRKSLSKPMIDVPSSGAQSVGAIDAVINLGINSNVNTSSSASSGQNHTGNINKTTGIRSSSVVSTSSSMSHRQRNLANVAKTTKIQSQQQQQQQDSNQNVLVSRESSSPAATTYPQRQSADGQSSNQCQSNVKNSPRKPKRDNTATNRTSPANHHKNVSKIIPIPTTRTTILNKNNQHQQQLQPTVINGNGDHSDTGSFDDRSAHSLLDNTKPPSIIDHHSLMSQSSASSIDSEISDIGIDNIPLQPKQKREINKSSKVNTDDDDDDDEMENGCDQRTYNKNDLKRNKNDQPIGYNYYESDQSDTDISEILPLDDYDPCATIISNNSTNPIDSVDGQTTTTTTTTTNESNTATIVLYNKPNIDPNPSINDPFLAQMLSTSPQTAATAMMMNNKTRATKSLSSSSSTTMKHSSQPKSSASVHSFSHHNNNNNNNSDESYGGHQLERLEDLESETRYRPNSRNRNNNNTNDRMEELDFTNGFNQQFNSFNQHHHHDRSLNFVQNSRSLQRGHKFMIMNNNTKADFEDRDMMFTSKHRKQVVQSHARYFQNKSSLSSSSSSSTVKTSSKYFDRHPIVGADAETNNEIDLLLDSPPRLSTTSTANHPLHHHHVGHSPLLSKQQQQQQSNNDNPTVSIKSKEKSLLSNIKSKLFSSPKPSKKHDNNNVKSKIKFWPRSKSTHDKLDQQQSPTIETLPTPALPLNQRHSLKTSASVSGGSQEFIDKSSVTGSMFDRLIPTRRSLANHHETMIMMKTNLTRSTTYDSLPIKDVVDDDNYPNQLSMMMMMNRSNHNISTTLKMSPKFDEYRYQQQQQQQPPHGYHYGSLNHQRNNQNKSQSIITQQQQQEPINNNFTFMTFVKSPCQNKNNNNNNSNDQFIDQESNINHQMSMNIVNNNNDSNMADTNNNKNDGKFIEKQKNNKTRKDDPSLSNNTIDSSSSSSSTLNSNSNRKTCLVTTV